MRVLAIDPGTTKCGVALLEHHESHDEKKNDGTILYRAVLPVSELLATLTNLIATYAPDAILLGNGTRHSKFQREISQILPPDVPLHLVDERHTSERARARFVRENPPKFFLHHLLPVALRTPDRPYDDYVALILAEDFISR